MSMSYARVRAVRDLCAEVNHLAALVEQAMTSEEDHFDPTNSYPYYHQPKLTGELRRRSMDLTRALADLRNPNR